MIILAASVFFVLWLVCGFISYGFSLAYFQREYNCYGMAKADRKGDVMYCLLDILFGPVALATVIQLGFNRHGWMATPLPDTEINYGPEFD